MCTCRCVYEYINTTQLTWVGIVVVVVVPIEAVDVQHPACALDEAVEIALPLPPPGLVERSAQGGLFMREHDNNSIEISLDAADALGKSQPPMQLGAVRSQRRGLALPPIGGNNLTDGQRPLLLAPAGRVSLKQTHGTPPSGHRPDPLPPRQPMAVPRGAVGGGFGPTPVGVVSTPVEDDVTAPATTPDIACEHSVCGQYDTPRRKHRTHRSKQRHLPAIQSGSSVSQTHNSPHGDAGEHVREFGSSSGVPAEQHEPNVKESLEESGSTAIQSTEQPQRAQRGDSDPGSTLSELPSRTLPSDLPPRGATVELHGLRSEAYNGQEGTVHGHDPDGTRCIVRLHSTGEKRNIKTKNLRVVNAPSQLRGRKTRDSLKLNVHVTKLPRSLWTVDSNSNLGPLETNALDSTWDAPPVPTDMPDRARESHRHGHAQATARDHDSACVGLATEDGGTRGTALSASPRSGAATAGNDSHGSAAAYDDGQHYGQDAATPTFPTGGTAVSGGADEPDAQGMSTPPRGAEASGQRRPATPYVRHHGNANHHDRERVSAPLSHGNGRHSSQEETLPHTAIQDDIQRHVRPRDVSSSDRQVAGMPPGIKSILRQTSRYASQDSQRFIVDVPQYGYDFVMNNCLLHKDEVLQNTRVNSVVAPISSTSSGIRFSMRRHKSSKRRIRFPDEGAQNLDLFHTQEFDKEDMVMHLLNGETTVNGSEDNGRHGSASAAPTSSVPRQQPARDVQGSSGTDSRGITADDDDNGSRDFDSNSRETDSSHGANGTSPPRADSPDADDSEPSLAMSKCFNTTIRLADLRKNGNGMYDFSYMNGAQPGNELFV